MIRLFNAYILFPYLEKRSGRQIRPKLDELRSFHRLGKTDRTEIRKREFHRALLFAREKVPYYRDLFQRLSFDIDRILRDLKFIQDLPVLTKEIIRENTDRLRLPEAGHARKTGGSTGQSVFFYYDGPGLDWTSALNLWAYELAGNAPHLPDCHISSELGMLKPPLKERFLDALKLFAQNRKRVMIRSFSDEDLKKTFRQLRRNKPYLLQGHPSSGYAIANYIKLNGLKRKTYCEVFEPSGEMMTPKIAAAITDYLGCKVVNRYGNAEFGVMAHSRPQDDYRKLLIFDRAFYIEEVDQGSLIVSNCTNLSFPLFRYDTGDLGTVRHEDDGSFIYDLQGRIHDLVRIAGEEYATHYIMDYLDHKIRGVREFQILVDSARNPLLNIVPEDATDRPRIERELRARWPQGLDIGFIRHEQLVTAGWRQKFRHIIRTGGPVES